MLQNYGERARCKSGGLDIVAGDDYSGGGGDAGIGQRAFLLGVIDEHRFAGAVAVVNSQGMSIDEHLRLGVAAEVTHNAGAEVAVADDNDEIFHLAGEHAAGLLRVVALDSLKGKK